MGAEGFIERGEHAGRKYAPHFLVLLICLAGLLGGGSRQDIVSLPYLRAIAAIAIAAACIVITRREVVTIKWPLLLLVLIAAIGAIQLLPISMRVTVYPWPRQIIRELDQILGYPTWRPITLSPSATMNSLGSLLVPLAVLMWLAISQSRTAALLSLLGLGLVSACVGLLQMFADPRSGLFFYDITSNGPVGLFANRNHAAVFLACCLLITIYLYKNSHLKVRPALPYIAALFAVCILTNPSRAGLLALGIAAVIGAGTTRSTAKVSGPPGWLLPLAGVGTCAGAVAVFILSDRVPALSRIMENPSLTDLRSELNPISLQMLWDFFPWGSGLSTYEHAYRLFEPADLLMPAYVNEAHNDWLQFPIETGLPGILLITAAIGLVVYRIAKLHLWRSRDNSKRLAWLGGAILLVLSVTSLVDYPVRVPAIAVLAIVALAFFSGFREDDVALP